ncbi:hypothetical protein Hanom_Chr05g00391261 [Helianthus anomalus]
MNFFLKRQIWITGGPLEYHRATSGTARSYPSPLGGTARSYPSPLGIMHIH